MEEVPNNLRSIGTIMSNFDHRIEDGSENRLREEPVFGEYSAWDFWAAVWFADGVFKCMVKRYCSHIATFSAASLREIMEEACDKYGDL
jgi:hypothetical protein